MFLPGIRAIRQSQRALGLPLRRLFASSSRSALQSFRARAAFRRQPRPPPEKCSPQHQGASVTVTIIDYGAGNVPSVERALQKLGFASKRVTQPNELAGASPIILPGVPHYAAIIPALAHQNLPPPLPPATPRALPFL